MISTTFDYAAPATLAGVLELLSQGGHQVLPTDHSLVSSLRQGTGPTGHTLVSLRNVPGLNSITQKTGQLVIGASATYAELLQHPALEFYPVLAGALATIQDPHLRHNSTLGGALHVGGRVHAPVLAALLALNATAVVVSNAGTTELPLQQFAQRGRRVLPAADSVVTQVLVSSELAASSYYQTAGQQLGYYPNYGVAVAMRATTGEVTQSRIVLAGFTEQPLQLELVEAVLQNQSLNATTIRTATEQFDEEALPTDFGSADTDEGYYRHLAKVLVRRALTALVA
jgi:CO/xanthine dehydrogenase FAD-binding subunit